MSRESKLAQSLLLFLSFLAFLRPVACRADSLAEYEEKISQYEAQKLEYLQKLEELKQAKVSLENEIAYFDTQISLTQTEINETEARLDEAEERLSALRQDINVLGAKITSLSGSIDNLQREVARLLARRYKEARRNPLDYLFASPSLSILFNKLKYLATLAEEDKLTINQLTSAKVIAQQEKDALDVKKNQVEELKNTIAREKRELEEHRAVLGAQRAGKANLLALTENDERKYQEMLAKVEAEISAIRSAIGNLASLKFEREVARGEVIGVQGSTGWSTGDHLHFAVYHSPYVFYQDMEDPVPYLLDGRLGWPIDAHCYEWAYQCLEGHSVSQPYGVSDISKSMKWYPNDFHDAIDLFGPAGSLVYAAEAGHIAYGTDSAGGNYAMIKHSNGLITMYWHLR